MNVDLTKLYFNDSKRFYYMNNSNVEDYDTKVTVYDNNKNKYYKIGLPYPDKCPYNNTSSKYVVIKATNLTPVEYNNYYSVDYSEGNVHEMKIPFEYEFAVLYKCKTCHNYVAVNYDEICGDDTPETNALIVPYFCDYTNEYPFSSQQRRIIKNISPKFKENYLFEENDFNRYKNIVDDNTKSSAIKEHLYKMYCIDCRKNLEMFIRDFLSNERKLWTKKFNHIRSIDNKVLSKISSKKKFTLKETVNLLSKLNYKYVHPNRINKIGKLMPKLNKVSLSKSSLGENISKLQVINEHLAEVARFLSKMGNYGAHPDKKNENKTYKIIKLSHIHKLMYDFILMASNYILNIECAKEVNNDMNKYSKIIK